MHHLRPADPATVQAVLDRRERGMATAAEVDHPDDARLADGIRDRPGVGHGRGQRLLDQDVLPRAGHCH
jgi:hypothetical protein